MRKYNLNALSFVFILILWLQTLNAQKDTLYNATDEAVIGVDTNYANVGTREVRDFFVQNSAVNQFFSIIANENYSVASNYDWELIDNSSNLDTVGLYNSNSSGLVSSIIGMPASLAEEYYSIAMMARDTAGAKSGIISTVFDQIDRYRTEIAITYVDTSGLTEVFTYKVNNAYVKDVFGWDPTQPIPFYPTTGISSTDTLAFTQSMLAIESRDQVEESIIRNRNTPSGVGAVNPWYADQQFIDVLVSHVFTQNEPYPIGINVSMIDYSGTKSSQTFAPEEIQPLEELLNKSATNDSLNVYGSMPDQTIPSDMQGGPNQVWGWGTEYTVTLPDSTASLDLNVFGGSLNLTYDTLVQQSATNPLEYTVHVILKTGNQNSIENLTVDFESIITGIDDAGVPREEIKMYQNYPNPFDDHTTISYSLSSYENVTLNVLDVNGKVVANLFNGQQGPSEHKFTWNGQGLKSGMYILKIQTESENRTERIVKY